MGVAEVAIQAEIRTLFGKPIFVFIVPNPSPFAGSEGTCLKYCIESESPF